MERLLLLWDELDELAGPLRVWAITVGGNLGDAARAVRGRVQGAFRPAAARLARLSGQA